jgi:hypothetical protein
LGGLFAIGARSSTRERHLHPVHVLLLRVDHQTVVARALLGRGGRREIPDALTDALSFPQLRHRDLVLAELVQPRHQLLVRAIRPLLRRNGQRQKRNFRDDHHKARPLTNHRPTSPRQQVLGENLRPKLHVVKRVLPWALVSAHHT